MILDVIGPGLRPDHEEEAERAKALAELKQQINYAMSELETLREIVASLPVTEDGVPVTPGMDVWVSHGNQPAHAVTITKIVNGGVFRDCYSSKDAASQPATAVEARRTR
jgi:hypothetical protein